MNRVLALLLGGLLLALPLAGCSTQKTSSISSSSSASSSDPDKDRISQLESQLSQMEQQLNQLQSSSEPSATSSAPAQQPAPQPPAPQTSAPSAAGSSSSSSSSAAETRSKRTELYEDEIEAVYAYNVQDQTYNRLPDDVSYSDLVKQINKLSVTEKTAVIKPASDQILVTLKDGSKYLYYLMDDMVCSPDTILDSTQGVRDTLIGWAKSCAADYVGAPQWLAFMSTGLITRINLGGYASNGSDTIKIDTTDAEAIKTIGNALKSLTVKPGGTQVSQGQFNVDTSTEAISIRIYFSTDITYDITICNSDMTINCSDMPVSMSYKFSNVNQTTALRNTAQKVMESLKK